MSNLKVAAIPAEKINERSGPDRNGERGETKASLADSLKRYALLGAAAVLLLSLVELVDANVRLAPLFQSLSERIAFAAYFSINLIVGLIVGLLVGAVAQTILFSKAKIESSFARRVKLSRLHRFIIGGGVLVFTAFLMKQQAHVSGYATGLIREAEKFAILRHSLMNHETAASYLVVAGLLFACACLWMLTRRISAMSNRMKAAWIAVLIIASATSYYIDSRLLQQQYEYSLHHSLFLLSLALSMALVGSIYLSARRIDSLRARPSAGLKKVVVVFTAVMVLAASGFTFARFDDNQNLKAAVFYRTAQAKQYFELVQWAMDFDRDGYSPILGGGDFDDRRGDINPGQPEVIGDLVDNNCLEGDLNQQSVAEWRQEQNPTPTAANGGAVRLNIIYLFIDALRADHLGAYGYERNTSPNIDRLAARSAVFENGFSPSSNTFQALPRFMQSSYWDGKLESWSRVLSRNGYDVLIFPGRRGRLLLRHVKGAKKVAEATRQPFDASIDTAISLLANAPADRPFCAYIYSFDPHRPYDLNGRFYFGPSAMDRYDGEIASVDFHLGRLFNWMEESGRIDDTMVVIMSDHGESFGERGVYEHASQVYNDQLRVPMIIYVPGLAPRRLSEYVSTINIGTTILDAVGIAAPKEYSGASLLPLMRGESLSLPPVYAEYRETNWSRHVKPDQNVHPDSKKFMIITQDGFKLIYNRNYYNFELFDLNADPGEGRNLYDRLPDKSREMRSRLGRFVDVVEASRPSNADEY